MKDLTTPETAEAIAIPAAAALSIYPMPPFGEPIDVRWEDLRPGVQAAWLYRHDPDGPRAALLRYQPGASVPDHEHLGYEHIFVLQGAQSDESRAYPAGTLTIFPPGLSHRIVSATGCVVLAIWTGPIRFAQPPDE